ncbi:MAG: ferrous iron transport protein A [Acidimicrobiia bacterium]|nr:ferrous iron transport protein A [Acidimicrobiia bacterium]MDH3397210.1 ferrous iron transport protein A [Acidimicrobiia bacterium]
MSRALSEVPRGETVRLAGVDADRGTVHRLAEMGLTPGVALTVLQTSKGPVLVAVRGARVAVGRKMATTMRVVSNGTGAGA